MSQILETPPSETLTRGMVRITADQYHRMIEDEIIPEDSSTELLDGVIVHKDTGDTGDEPMGHGPLHRLAVRMLTRIAAKVDSDLRHLQIQLPVHLAESNEPEPDGAIILGTDREFADRLPGAKDIATVIEIANSSLALDRTMKRDYYAAAGIPQYIIVNLRAGRIEVLERPDKRKGLYKSAATLVKGKTVRLNLGRGEFLEVQVETLLP